MMQNILRERVLDFSLVFTIAATIFQSSAPVLADEYYIANATLILIESQDDIYFDIENELPMPTITYKEIEDPDYGYDISTYGYIRNSSNTDTINVLITDATYNDGFMYIMSRPNNEFDYYLLYVALKYLLPNTFDQEDGPAFPQPGPYLISKGFTQLLTVDEAIPCNEPWYFHAYLTRDSSENDDYTVLLKAIYQMDMHPIYYCSPSKQ